MLSNDLKTAKVELSSDATPEHLSVDPANRLLWRHAPRRLDAEEIRDALLASAGNIETDPPNASPAKDLQVRELRNNSEEATQLVQAAKTSRNRSIYLPLLRGLTPQALEVFDFAEQGMVTGRRDTTTIAPQALYLLNSPFVHKQSATLAQRVLAEASLENDTQRIVAVYQLALGRQPDASEVTRAIRYMEAYAEEFRGLPQAFDASAPALLGDGIASTFDTVNPPEASPPNDANDEDLVAAESQAEHLIAVTNIAELVDTDPQSAALASFAQAIYGSAEFRYLR